MISYEALKNLTDEDIAELEELRAIAAEAEEAEKLIKETWHSRVIWEDDENGITETLSNGEKWTIQVAGKGYYTLLCDASTIFDYLYAEYVHNEKRPCALKDRKVSRMAEICDYFRKFLKRTREEHDGVAE